MSDKDLQTNTTRTTCPYCGVGCGVLASVGEHEVVINGDPDHPANYGKLCSKGLTLGSTFNDPQRLLQPTIVVDNTASKTTWDIATSHIADTFVKTIERHGRDSIAFYISGQLLTEDYYVVNKFVKGWLGTANVDTNSRLCMASSVAGHKRAFGSDTVPGCYEDLDTAELIILVGSNLAWCHPVIYQRIIANKDANPNVKIIVIDPRRSITADNADLHLAIKSDGDTLLFNALLKYLATHNKVDKQYINEHVFGYQEAVQQAFNTVSDNIADELGVTHADLQTFFKLFGEIEKSVTIYSQGVNQSSSGTDKVNAILNCHLATGRIGKPGMGPFSITGQPNAMGGREVGGMATMLACHRDLNNRAHQSQVQRFWNSPHIAAQKGLTAVEMFDAVKRGKIKAIWIMATNPVDSMPDADSVKKALAGCPFVVVSDVTTNSDTLDFAHVALPAQAFGEKDGTVTNSERRISRQRRFIKPAGDAKPDWWAVSQVAQKMGYANSFSYTDASQIFSEYAKMSAFENNGSIDFDIGAYSSLSPTRYDKLTPFQWPQSTARQHDNATPLRFFANGQFYTPDRKARMIAVKSASPGNQHLCDQRPLSLNTGRIRDQWHTMTRTGYIPRLMNHRAEPFVEINPGDALMHGISDADIVSISSATGSVLARAMLTDRQTIGQVFAPMHWSDKFASKARIGTLIAPVTDPHSRQPASKNQAVSIQRFAANSYALLLTRDELLPGTETQADTGIDYWAKSPLSHGWRYEMASACAVPQLRYEILKRLSVHTRVDNNAQKIERVDYRDQNAQRIAFIENGRTIHSLLFLATDPVLASRSWATEAFARPINAPADRWRLMAGRAASNQPDKGAIVCSCFEVGHKEIARAITSGGCNSVGAVGKKLKAGTNCGSCRNEISVLVRELSPSRVSNLTTAER